MELDFIQRVPVAKKLQDCILTALEEGCDHWCMRRRDNPVIREASPFFLLQESTWSAEMHHSGAWQKALWLDRAQQAPTHFFPQLASDLALFLILQPWE